MRGDNALPTDAMRRKSLEPNQTWNNQQLHLCALGSINDIYIYIRKSRPEPIGVRGCAGGGDARGVGMRGGWG